MYLLNIVESTNYASGLLSTFASAVRYYWIILCPHMVKLSTVHMLTYSFTALRYRQGGQSKNELVLVYNRKIRQVRLCWTLNDIKTYPNKSRLYCLWVVCNCYVSGQKSKVLVAPEDNYRAKGKTVLVLSIITPFINVSLLFITTS